MAIQSGGPLRVARECTHRAPHFRRWAYIGAGANRKRGCRKSRSHTQSHDGAQSTTLHPKCFFNSVNKAAYIKLPNKRKNDTNVDPPEPPYMHTFRGHGYPHGTR